MRHLLWLFLLCAPVQAQDLLVVSPHRKDGELHKGQLHCHSARSDGKQSAEVLLRAYGGAGYDFVALTDHLLVGEAPRVDGVTWIPASEVHTTAAELGNGWGGHHVGAIGVRTDPRAWDRTSTASVLRKVAAEGGLAIAYHPRVRNRWSLAQLRAAKPLHLLSVFNGRGYDKANRTIPGGGSALYSNTAQWDALLAEGRVLWGVATDDCHDVTRPEWFDQGWVRVRAPTRKRSDLLTALRLGDVYACRGPKGRAPALAIQVERDDEGWAATATTDDGAQVRWVGKSGVLATGEGKLAYRLQGDEVYLRAEAWDPAQPDARCYAQPLRVVQGPRLRLTREDDGWLLTCDDADGKPVRVLQPLRIYVRGGGTVRMLGAKEAGSELVVDAGRDFVRFQAEGCEGSELLPHVGSGWPATVFPAR